MQADVRRAWLTVIAGTLTMTVSYVDRQTLAVLAPTVRDALHISNADYGWLGSGFSLAYLVATPLSGLWLDRVGARRGLARSLLAWSCVAALHALVPGFAALFCLRVALGCAEGPGFPGGAQTVQRMLPLEHRPRGFGILFIGSSLGGMLTPPLASWLFRTWGWRTAFLGTAVVGLAWIPLWLYATRSPAVRAQIDPRDDADRPALGLAVHVRRVAKPAVARAVIAVVASSPVVLFVEQWSAQCLSAEHHVLQADMGHYLWLPPVWFDLGAVAFGSLAAVRARALRPLYGIAALFALSIALLPDATSPWSVIAVMSAAQIGSGALRTLVTADLLARMPRDSIALAAGVLACGQSIAYIAAGPLIGYAHDHGVAYSTIAVWIAAWLVPGTLFWLASGREPIRAVSELQS